MGSLAIRTIVGGSSVVGVRTGSPLHWKSRVCFSRKSVYTSLTSIAGCSTLTDYTILALACINRSARRCSHGAAARAAEPGDAPGEHRPAVQAVRPHDRARAAQRAVPAENAALSKLPPVRHGRISG